MDKTLSKYIMVNMGYFPAVLEYENIISVKGETYLIEEKLMKVLDEFEGKWFFRKAISFESGILAQAYFLLPETIKWKYHVIKDGEWTIGNGKQKHRYHLL